MNYEIIKELKTSKIVVIKIGSNTLVDKDQDLKKDWLQSLVKDIQKLTEKKN